MKELQRTASFYCYNNIVAGGASRSRKELMSKAHLLYFGNPNDDDSVGFAQQLVNGVGSFSALQA